jgi:hypothetical protein
VTGAASGEVLFSGGDIGRTIQMAESNLNHMIGSKGNESEAAEELGFHDSVQFGEILFFAKAAPQQASQYRSD